MKQGAEDQKEKALVCFDFDHTIVNSHYHNTLATQKIQGYSNTSGPFVYEKPASNANAVEETTKNLLRNSDTGIKNGEQLAKTMKQLIADGHDVAITSFSQYPDAIKTTLATILTEEELKKVKIVVGFPKDGPLSENAKTEHIELAMKEFNVTDKSKVVLVDDSIKNVNVARTKGFGAVSVPIEDKNITYLDELNKEVNKIAQIDKQQEKTTTYDLSKVLSTITTDLGRNEASKFKSGLYDQMKSDGIKIDYNKGNSQLIIKGELTPEQKGKYDKIVDDKLGSLKVQEKTTTYDLSKVLNTITNDLSRDEASKFKTGLFKEMQKDGINVDYNKGKAQLIIKGELTAEQKGKYDKLVNDKLGSLNKTQIVNKSDSLSKTQTTNVVIAKQSLISKTPKKSLGQSVKEKVERLKSNLIKLSQRAQSELDKRKGEQKLPKNSKNNSRDTSGRGF